MNRTDRIHSRAHRAGSISTIDWDAMIKLAIVVGAVAAFAAIAFAPLLGETTVILLVILAGTVLGWRHSEPGAAALRTIPVRKGQRS